MLPPYTFRFKFADDAFVLKHPVQNFALGEAASFMQWAVLHFLVAFALALALVLKAQLKRWPLPPPLPVLFAVAGAALAVGAISAARDKGMGV